MSFELRDHTADVAVEARGGSLGEVYAAVADGLVAAMCDDVPGGGERRTVAVHAESRESLLLLVRNALSYLLLLLGDERRQASRNVLAEGGPAFDCGLQNLDLRPVVGEFGVQRRFLLPQLFHLAAQRILVSPHRPDRLLVLRLLRVILLANLAQLPDQFLQPFQLRR